MHCGMDHDRPLPTLSLNRRRALALFGTGVAISALSACSAGVAEARSFPVELSEAQWRAKLTRAEFYVLRQEGTERAYSSPLDKENRKGLFACAGCGNRLYASRTKFDSGTGWPSFWAALPGAVGTARDRKLGYARTEVHCADCGGHLGHIFDDGPEPTGKRHCINGVAMDFMPA
jgi:peptide-methionine (R)-S-oxide reductase